jgi:hypothetical protein
VEQKDSETGDKCHYNIINCTKKEARRLWQEVALSSLEICANDGIRYLKAEDLLSYFNIAP